MLRDVLAHILHTLKESCHTELELLGVTMPEIPYGDPLSAFYRSQGVGLPIARSTSRQR